MIVLLIHDYIDDLLKVINNDLAKNATSNLLLNIIQEVINLFFIDIPDIFVSN